MKGAARSGYAATVSVARASYVEYAQPVMADSSAPSFEESAAASRRIAGHARRTPVLRSRTADQRVGAEVCCKCENFQRVGAFKFRGAFNALSQFDAPQRGTGVAS